MLCTVPKLKLHFQEAQCAKTHNVEAVSKDGSDMKLWRLMAIVYVMCCFVCVFLLSWVYLAYLGTVLGCGMWYVLECLAPQKENSANAVNTVNHRVT